MTYEISFYRVSDGECILTLFDKDIRSAAERKGISVEECIRRNVSEGIHNGWRVVITVI